MCLLESFAVPPELGKRVAYNDGPIAQLMEFESDRLCADSSHIHVLHSNRVEGHNYFNCLIL